MNKVLFYIIAIIFASLLSIYSYKIFSHNKTQNSFVRNFVDFKIKNQHSIILDNNMYSIAGGDAKSITLMNFLNAASVITLGYTNRNIKRSELDLPKNFSYKGLNVFGRIHADEFYLNNGLGQLAQINQQSETVHNLKNMSVSLVQPINKNQIVLRNTVVREESASRELIKIDLSGHFETKAKHLLEKQVDGFFCTDGQLNFDKKTSRLFYMYYYRGEYLCLDTNLNLIYKGDTIDTVSKAKIKMQKIYTSKIKGDLGYQISQASPPTNLVNRYLAINGTKLYILSSLKADNESDDNFSDHQPIDVYSLNNGLYLYSFHIPKFKKQKMTEFQVEGKTLIGIYGVFAVSRVFDHNL